MEEHSEGKIHMSEPESGIGNVNNMYYIIWTLTAIHYLNNPDLLPYWPRSSVVRALEELNPEDMGSNPTEVKFSLAHGDSQISFNNNNTQGGLGVSAVLPT